MLMGWFGGADELMQVSKTTVTDASGAISGEQASLAESVVSLTAALCTATLFPRAGSEAGAVARDSWAFALRPAALSPSRLLRLVRFVQQAFSSAARRRAVLASLYPVVTTALRVLPPPRTAAAAADGKRVQSMDLRDDDAASIEAPNREDPAAGLFEWSCDFAVRALSEARSARGSASSAAFLKNWLPAWLHTARVRSRELKELRPASSAASAHAQTLPCAFPVVARYLASLGGSWNLHALADVASGLKA
jgi:hypothetical protein